jgi:hypothetical protein
MLTQCPCEEEEEEVREDDSDRLLNQGAVTKTG